MKEREYVIAWRDRMTGQKGYTSIYKGIKKDQLVTKAKMSLPGVKMTVVTLPTIEEILKNLTS